MRRQETARSRRILPCHGSFRYALFCWGFFQGAPDRDSTVSITQRIQDFHIGEACDPVDKVARCGSLNGIAAQLSLPSTSTSCLAQRGDQVPTRVTTEHYRLVGEALLWTLERGLGQDLTPEVRSAWANVYHVLAATMQAGAAEVANVQAAE